MDKGWAIKYFLTDLISYTAEQTPKPRNEIWASDLGKPFIDRYLQMKGEPYSNPSDGQGLFNFFLGKQLEKGVADMLKSCHIAHSAQEKITIQAMPEKDYLPVVGKPDLILEVKNWKDVLNNIDEAIEKLTDEDSRLKDKKTFLKGLVGNWQEKYPEGLRKTVFEIKSINSMAFRYHKNTGGLSNAYPHHKLQLYTYMNGLHLDEGHILYVAKDTGFIEEIVIQTSNQLDKEWRDDIKTITKYFKANQMPPLEPLEIGGKGNWRAKYSRYYDLLYKKTNK